MNTKPKIVGLTGGIACGKSTVRKMFEALGVPSLDLDIVAREIHQNPNHPVMEDLRQAFPSAVTPDGVLARSVMRDILANDPTANALLKALMTPHIQAYLDEWLADKTANYVIWESALLYEIYEMSDRIIVVDVSPALQSQRLQARNPDWSPHQRTQFMLLQPDRQEYLSLAAMNGDVLFTQPLDAMAGAVSDLHFKLMVWSAE